MRLSHHTTSVYLGELGLDGTLRPIRGVLGAVKAAAAAGYTEVVVPIDNATEAACIDGITVYGAATLADVIRHSDHTHSEHKRLPATAATQLSDTWTNGAVDLDDIKGQETAKRALIIAAAGRHNVLLVGPPGTGKTMLAREFRGLLPPLSRSETLEVAAIRSLVGEEDILSTQPPFRSPHHTASYTALVGGGTYPRPGEVTLAHKGVLFMDEFPEFDRRALDALRQPLEDRVVSISRVQGTALFPADFILVAALNPYRGSEDGTTDLARAMQETYRGKISGPILDRIDMWIEVPHVPYELLATQSKTKDSTAIARTRITEARTRQANRLLGRGVITNSAMTSRDIDDTITLPVAVTQLLQTSAAKLNLSPRSYHRLIKVACTIADLEGVGEISTAHVLEALSYRVKVVS
jgi:magnesium chelatase family protein